jgi:hypothetical protein
MMLGTFFYKFFVVSKIFFIFAHDK